MLTHSFRICSYIANGFLLPATTTRRTGRAVSNVICFLAKPNIVEYLERMMNCGFDGTPVLNFHGKKQNAVKIKKKINPVTK